MSNGDAYPHALPRRWPSHGPGDTTGRPIKRPPEAVPEVETVLQQVELELYRDNLAGALERLEHADGVAPDPRYAARALQIRAWLGHLRSHEAYAAAYERYYRRCKGGISLKHLEREIRILLGRKTWKTVRRTAQHPEYQLLEAEVVKHRPRMVLEAGCGEGRIAITLGHRCPATHVTGVEVSGTNIAIARRVNRFPNVAFEQGLIETLADRLPAGTFDLAYAFGVLEHVANLEFTVAAILRLLRPGGRFCFVVPMNDLKAVAPVPEFRPLDGVAGHVRAFTAAGLERQFGDRPGFSLTRIPGRWRPERYPAGIAPVEFGSFFVACSRAGAR